MYIACTYSVGTANDSPQTGNYRHRLSHWRNPASTTINTHRTTRDGGWIYPCTAILGISPVPPFFFEFSFGLRLFDFMGESGSLRSGCYFERGFALPRLLLTLEWSPISIWEIKSNASLLPSWAAYISSQHMTRFTREPGHRIEWLVDSSDGRKNPGPGYRGAASSFVHHCLW